MMIHPPTRRTLSGDETSYPAIRRRRRRRGRNRLVPFYCSVLLLPTAHGIINGYDAQVNEYPWFVSLLDNECGGTLVSPTRVLTAAHCFLGDLNNFVPGGNAVLDVPQVKIGHTTLDAARFNGEVVDVECVSIHPEFSAGGFVTSGFFNDLAIVKLAQPATITTTFVTINNNTHYPANSATRGRSQKLTVIGFGGEKTLEAWFGAEPPSTLQQVHLQPITMKECQDTWPCVDDQYHLCANQPNTNRRQGFCQGDSGGPLLDSNNVQVGINSFLGVVCGSATPDVFTPVANYYDWIQKEIRSKTCATRDQFATSPFYADTPACQEKLSWFRLIKNMIVGAGNEIIGFFPLVGGNSESEVNRSGRDEAEISIDEP